MTLFDRVLGWLRPTPIQVVLYTRAECHLCDQAREELERHVRRFHLVITEMNIDADERLRAFHGDWVPVVEIDGVIRFRGRVNPVLLRRLLVGMKRKK